ncbi:hypothetical protein EH243_00040 [Amphritea opalescens]|uniref:Uncharacterized protein n=1 Tax=Amphritea opalescens TaxID=2490544 RepID=A0A430KV69_9GAMM|nr:hypothetical protein [Amphritea opalescens]RTE67380.1 hypothetical protein EH243_00040 [Amphritea opalescens]
MDDVAKGQNLDDFLINLADGLSKAQSRLNQYPVMNAMGQQSMVYHIPRMEFELKLQMTASGTAPVGAGRSQAYQKKARLQFLPIKTSQQSSSSATSIIKGVMVAAPMDATVPQIQLSLSVEKTSARKAEVKVLAQTSTDSSLKGAVVELNIDRELSEKMGKGALKTSTRLERAALVLDENGRAEAGLVISNQEAEGQMIALTADLFGQSQTLLYRFEQGR